MAEKEQNRSEQATPFKLEEARKQGQVAKSLDFNTLLMIWGLLGLMAIWGASAWQQFGTLAQQLLASSADLDLSLSSGNTWLGHTVMAFLSLLVPVFLVGAGLAIVANFVQTGPIFTFQPLKPKGERINPVAGFKRVFNKKMLFEAFKSLLKLFFLGGIVVAFFWALWPQLPAVELLVRPPPSVPPPLPAIAPPPVMAASSLDFDEDFLPVREAHFGRIAGLTQNCVEFEFKGARTEIWGELALSK